MWPNPKWDDLKHQVCEHSLSLRAETVSDAVTRGEFPMVMLNPVNFESLYQQQQQKAQAESGGMTIY